jgi:hypothetical protein
MPQADKPLCYHQKPYERSIVMKKKLFSLLLVLVLMLGIMTVPAVADKVDRDDVAYLMYADGSWKYSYWGDEAENGVKPINATVTGPGEYTVGLDFTGTEDGEANKLSFTAVGIKNGELTFPRHMIELLSIKVNGEEIEFTKGYTSSDDKITTRMNIYNSWVGEVPLDARSYDHDISDVSPIIVSEDDFVSVKTVEVTFKLHAPSDTACIMYADSSWTYSYFGGEPENDVIANNATVTGPGTYSVGLDFTQTADGKASGLAFAALGINTGERSFPGYLINIKEIKVNGNPISFSKGYTSTDEGVTTRMNIFNEWVSGMPKDARSWDGEVDDANWIIIDKAAFDSVETVEVTFEYGLPEVEAFIMFADSAWTYEYFGSPVDTGIVAANAAVKGEGIYRVALDFTGTKDKAASGLAFTAVGINDAKIPYDGWFIKIESIKINGEEIKFEKGYTSSDQKEIRMNIYNEWVGGLPEDARSWDSENTGEDLEGVSWVIVDPADFESVGTYEIEFAFMYGKKPIAEEEEIDIDALLAADYNAYFGIQTENYVFRNQWDEPNYGKHTDNFTHLTGWDDDSNQVDYAGKFTDASVTGNGTYTTGVELGPMGLGPDTFIRMLFVSTDIPSVLVNKGLVTISDVKTSFDGGRAQTKFALNTEGKFLQIDILNEYTATGTEAIPYSMPTKGITISFTVSGLSKDAGAAAETPAELPKTGGLPGEFIFVVGFAVTSLGIFLKARKEKND